MSLFDKFKNKKTKVEPAPDIKPSVIRELHSENGKDVEVLITLEEKIRREEQWIETQFPDAYRKFLMDTPFKEYQKFSFETPYDGIYFYPKAMEKNQTFGKFYVPDEADATGSWAETVDGEIGCLMVFLFGGQGFYSLFDCNNGSWTMPCICIGKLNDDLLIVLDCETGKTYCMPHDEVWFEFDSREDYDKEMQVIAKDVFFPDFESFLAWCKGDGVYTPKSFEYQ